MILKRKSRYVLVESSRPLDSGNPTTRNLMLSELMAYLGERAYSEMNPVFALQCSNSMFIVRVNRGTERYLLVALSFIKKLGGEKFGFYTLGISGTIRSLKERCKSYSVA